MLLVDSHCHLNFKDFGEDRAEVIRRAKDTGVGVMQTICTKLHEFEEIYAIAESDPDIYCSVGVHPHESAREPIPSPEALIAYANRPKTIGIGETGLDFYYEHSPRKEQEQSFRNHISASRETGLPLIVHSRSADEDTVRILEDEMNRGAFPGLIHCFSTTKYLSDHAIDLGFYISLSGILTFPKSQDLRDIAKTIPLQRLLVETDSPYLAPVPNRGKRNEPAFTRHTNKLLAEIKGVSEEECARVTTDNFFALFTKAKRPQAA